MIFVVWCGGVYCTQPCTPCQLHYTALHCPAGQFPTVDSKRLAVYLVEEAISRLDPAPVPGQEQVLSIFDLRGFGMDNMDISFVVFMVGAG